MFFSKNTIIKNNTDLDKYIKSHIPATYLLEIQKFESEAFLLDDLAKYFSQQVHFKEQFQSVTPTFKEHLLLNYKSVMQLLATIEPSYIDYAIDELWEGLQEDTIYSKYNKNGIINF